MSGHRSSVRSAVLAAAGELVAERGLGLTMSEIAERAGIGRATLYRHFRDVDAVLLAWHEHQVAGHLQHLTGVRDGVTGSAGQRLEAVLVAYAELSAHGPGGAAAGRLHRGQHMEPARASLHDFITELVVEAVRAGQVRSDVPAEELAIFLLGALSSTRSIDPAASRRLVTVAMDGVRALT